MTLKFVPFRLTHQEKESCRKVMKNSQQFYQRLSIILLVLFSISLSPSQAFPSKGDTFKKGQICQKRLFKSEKRKQFRHSWERCIGHFKTFVRSHKKGRKVEVSYYRLGQLYSGLGRYSGDKVFERKAVAYYKKVIQQFPKSRYSKSSKRSLMALGVSLPSPKTQPTIIKNINHWSFPAYTRVVIETSKTVQYRKDRISKPDRLYIDLENTFLPRENHNKITPVEDGILRKINIAQFNPKTVRVVLHLDQMGQYRIFSFENPPRLAIDLYGKGVAFKEVRGESFEINHPIKTPIRTNGEITLAQQLGLGVNTIVIDPGHGGKDPGAIGRKGLREKDVVLDISIRLKTLIEEKLHKKVILTRETDIFVPLDERTRIANANKADIFISIHTNSNPKRSTRGIEIYLVGQSTDRPAMATAARENSASERSMSDLELILNDLLENTKINESLELAHMTRQSFRRTLGSHYKNVVDLGVKRAPFYVLMNANMPSILAEVSFISNPQEEKRLNGKRYRQRVAQSLFEGIQQYISSIKVVSLR